MYHTKKLYQLIITRLDGNRINESLYSKELIDLVDKGLGGVIIFGGQRGLVSDFIEILQSRALVPLFISSDIERGVGQQIAGYGQIPCPMAVAAAIDRDNPQDVLMLKEALRCVVLSAIDCGINMPLLPVLDVNHNPNNPIICTRAFSDDPEIVGWFGEVYINAMSDLRLFSCAKHFPGHGDTEIDSHLRLPEINRSMQDLMRLDIEPFKRAVKAGVRSIMAGHISIPAIDREPASLSSVILNDILRKECGFNGIILTDALNMGALDAISDVSVKALNAGADILLHPSDADATVMELETAVNDNRLSMDRIDLSIERIMRLKAEIKDIKRESFDEGILSQMIVNKSITLVKGAPPLIKGSVINVVIVGEIEGRDISPFIDVLKARYRIKMIGAIASNLIKDNLKGQSVIFMVISKVAAWRGTSGINDIERSSIAAIIKEARESVVVSFGSPYLLSKFTKADGLVAAYEFTDYTLKACARCLTGESPFMGKLPVKIKID
jgi:beta-glucosidase-like glycosyl hydrolase